MSLAFLVFIAILNLALGFALAVYLGLSNVAPTPADEVQEPAASATESTPPAPQRS